MSSIDIVARTSFRWALWTAILLIGCVVFGHVALVVSENVFMPATMGAAWGMVYFLATWRKMLPTLSDWSNQ